MVKEINYGVKSKNLASNQSGSITLSISQYTSSNKKITIKHNKKLKVANLDSMKDFHVNITEPSKDSLGSWSKKVYVKSNPYCG